MFERYTEKARRAIFFARYEASQSGSHEIEPAHLLLGIFREDKGPATQALQIDLADLAAFQLELAKPGAEKISTSVDLPLSMSGQRVLAYGAEESERLQHAHIGNEHLLIGLLREDDPRAASFLKSHGASLESLRTEAREHPSSSAHRTARG